MFHRGGDVGAGGRKRLAVRRNLVLIRRAVGGYRAFAHHRAADDDRRTLGLGTCRAERGADLVDRLSVDVEHVPAPGLVFGAYVLGVHLVDLGRELDVVRVVVHDQVRQSQMTCDAAHALRNLLLHGAVRDVGIGLVRLPLAETGHHEALGDRCAQRHGVSLTQRAGGIFHTAQHVHFGVAGRTASPLAERFEIVHRVVARQRQCRVEHRRHVARIEEQAVAEGVAQVVGIVAQEFGVEHVDEIGAAHRAARMARFRLFDHRCRQHADVVRRTRQFCIVCHISSCLVVVNSSGEGRVTPCAVRAACRFSERDLSPATIIIFYYPTFLSSTKFAFSIFSLAYGSVTRNSLQPLDGMSNIVSIITASQIERRPRAPSL